MNVHSPDVIPVSDPRWPLIGQAAKGTLLASAVFFLFTVTKQIQPVYLHAPWAADPYDTVFSFTMLFVPVLAATVLVPLALCRSAEPMPTARIVTIQRGCRVAVGAIAVELLSAWVAVAAGARRSEWSALTTVLIALLILASIACVRVAIDLLRAPPIRRPEPGGSAGDSDWLADLIVLGVRASARLGPLRRPGLRVLVWADQTVVSMARRRPVAAAALSSGTFAITVLGWQSIREGYSLSVAGLEIALGFSGMFAFLVLAGSYLGIVRRQAKMNGQQRRMLHASVAACVALIAVLAFRDSLWWIVGSNAATSSAGQFAVLQGSTALVAFVVVLAAETARGRRAD